LGNAGESVAHLSGCLQTHHARWQAYEAKYPKATIKLAEELSKDDKVTAYEFVIVTADKKNIRLWHVPTGRNTATLPGDADEEQSVTFSPDGQSFATTSGAGTTHLWTFAPA